VTIAELLIVTVVLIILMSIMVRSNIIEQYKKAYESKKKTDLRLLSRIVEEYYADNNSYPAVSEMVYAFVSDTTNAGKLCGEVKTPTIIKPYLDTLPCNPYHDSGEDYIYFVYNNGQDYMIFTNLDTAINVSEQTQTCPFGCSYFTDPQFPNNSLSVVNSYNYFVSSGAGVFTCDPANYWAYYPNVNPNAQTDQQKKQRCNICPYLLCTNKSFTEVFCQSKWCQSYAIQQP
jgi:type II secretory pathway pseudopilin PulG